MNAVFKFIAPLVLLGPTACGSEDPSANPGNGTSTSNEPLLPWNTGNHWVYQVTDGDQVTTKETTVGELELVGGTGPAAELSAFKVVTSKQDGADETVSWQMLEGDRVLRYREQSFSASTNEIELEEHWDPYKLHIDWTAEHVVEGADWIEQYQETKLPVGEAPKTATNRDHWYVIAVGEEVTVPAATFTDTVVLRKVGGSTTKTYWYARGVGKVKETGGQTEELVDYEIVP